MRRFYKTACLVLGAALLAGSALIWALTQFLGDTPLMKILALVVSLALTVAVNLWIDRPIEVWRRRRLQTRRARAA